MTDIEHRWSEDQLARKAAAERGMTVVANMRALRGKPTRDGALIQWAKQHDRFVRIDRFSKSIWQNRYRITDTCDRDTAISRFADDLRTNEVLIRGLPALRGKVLGCWCHPERCHGHMIAEEVNGSGSLTTEA